MKNILLILLLLLAFTACGDKTSVTDVLNRAETLMDEHPDSSLTLLRTLTLDDFQQEANRARYALLHSQALDKNYIDVTSDSIISVAVDYYQDEEDVRNKFLSYYYMGRVHANGERYAKAVLSFLESEKLCKEIDDGYLIGLLYMQLGYIYKEYYDYSKSLESFKLASFNYKKAGKDLHYLYALTNQASIFKNISKHKESYRLYYDVLEEARNKEYNDLEELCLGDLIMLCTETGRLCEANSLYQEFVCRFDMSDMTLAFWADISEIHAWKEDWDTSERILMQAWKNAVTANDSIGLYFADAHIEEMKQSQSNAYNILLEGIKIQNRLVREKMEQPVLSAQSELLEKELEFQQYKLRTEKIHGCILVLFVSVLALTAIYYGQSKLRKYYRGRLQIMEDSHKWALEQLQEKMNEKDNKIHTLIEDFNKKLDIKDMNYRQVLVELENEIVSKDKLCSEYVRQSGILQNEKENILTCLVNLFRERIELVDAIICVRNSDFGSEKSNGKEFHVSVDEFINKTTQSRRSYQELENLVNVSCQNVMKRLRSEVKLPDEDSYRQACYHFAGYSVFAISVLMGVSKNLVYKRRSRVRKKIEETSSKSMDLFMKYIGK